MNKPFEGPTEQNLNNILATTWSMLSRGAVEADHPFHVSVLGTLGRYGPSLRTVVLRQVAPAERRLFCYTDRRSAKVTELQTHPQASWLFYDPGPQVQLRLAGITRLHFDDELAEWAWGRVSLASRQNYLTLQSPGTPLAQPGADLPAALAGRALSLAESEAGRPHFAVIVCQVTFLDWLHLSRTGHRRAQFVWQGEALKAKWVTP